MTQINNNTNSKRMLHELASKSFSRTPNGLIFTGELKDVFSVLLVCLELTEAPKENSRRLFAPFTKCFPFSFSFQEAVSKMNDLKLHVDMNATTMTISYAIKSDLAYSLLKTFMDAKLLHTPADRTRDEPKERVLLQPTPKGVAILRKYVRHVGLKSIPPILKSNLNSMELFTFERSSVTDSIIHSDYFIHLLFIKLMGSHPNVWSPTSVGDKLPALSTLIECSDDTFTFENLECNFNEVLPSSSVVVPRDTDVSSDLNNQELHDEGRQSPLAHKYFTNPDSDAHVQYYVSGTGLRLSKAKPFGKHKTTIDYCFTTKALWQWLMDCTDIMHPKEAVSIASLFLKHGLMVPILLSPSENTKKKFHVNKQSYYTLSKTGRDIVQWNSESSVKNSIHDSSGLKIEMPKRSVISTTFALTGSYIIGDETKSLDQTSTSDSEETYSNFNQQAVLDLNEILRDPGMRYLFRTHLEKEFCVENLDVYIEIKKFLKRMTVLKELIESRNITKCNRMKLRSQRPSESNISNTINSALIKQANECLAIAYHIYSSYIVIGAPCQLNIDHDLRESINKVMLHPQSPLSNLFPGAISVLENELNLDAGKISSNTASTSVPHITLKQPTAIAYSDLKLPQPLRYSTSRGPKPKPLDLGGKSSNAPTCSSEFFQIPPTPTDEVVSNTLKVLRQLFPLLDTVAKRMYRLMKMDSMPKFANSEAYEEAAALMSLQN